MAVWFYSRSGCISNGPFYLWFSKCLKSSSSFAWGRTNVDLSVPTLPVCLTGEDADGAAVLTGDDAEVSLPECLLAVTWWKLPAQCWAWNISPELSAPPGLSPVGKRGFTRDPFSYKNICQAFSLRFKSPKAFLPVPVGSPWTRDPVRGELRHGAGLVWE